MRSEGWRLIRYADGGQELYDETADPYEWKNLAGDRSQAARISELARYLPAKNAPDVSDSGQIKIRNNRRKARKNR